MENLGETSLCRYTYTVASLCEMDITESEDMTAIIESIKTGTKLEDEITLLKRFNKRARKRRRSDVASSTRRKRRTAGDPHAADLDGGFMPLTTF